MKHDNLWAPWRIGYIKTLSEEHSAHPNEPRQCFLCEAADDSLDAEGRREHLVLMQDERGVLLLNRFPYSNGHLLVAPLAHVPDICDLTPAQRAGLMELSEVGSRALKLAMGPQGMNLGMNMGRCAGAGVPGHAHMHVVPRWNGDVNFMEVVGSVRVVPQALTESYQCLYDALVKLGEV